MEKRFNRNLSSESRSGQDTTLERKLAESRRQRLPEPKPAPAPDLTDFMNDIFFGAANTEKKSYNLMGKGGGTVEDDGDGFDDSVRSNSGRSTQEWLEEAKRIVASSPSRGDSPSRLVASPRFASAKARSPAPLIDRRDPFSRSARRHRAVEGFGGEILAKSAWQSRNKSETFTEPTPFDNSPASAVHNRFSNILQNPAPVPPPPALSTFSQLDDTNRSSAPPVLPTTRSTPRKSRFHNDNPSSSQPQGIPTYPPERSFRNDVDIAAAPSSDTQLLSPPRNLVESIQRRSISSSTCSLSEKHVLSPPKNLAESAHRRPISPSTCSNDKISWKPNANEEPKENPEVEENQDLNEYLREQRIKIEKILNREINGKAKIVLSGPSNSTSSMVAAICYAWLLENRMRVNKEGGERNGNTAAEVVVPVMNTRRGRMWKQQQVAWLFHHVGLDGTALFFSDEVDLETLMMAKQLSILVIGEDVLTTNGKVGSQCTILTDNYCEDAYDLLQTPILKKLLLAGILLDTQNLYMFGRSSLTRDAEAVQLLLVGSTPNYRTTLYDQLMQNQRDDSFFEVLKNNYGKPPDEGNHNNAARKEDRVAEKKSSNHEAVSRQTDKNANDVKNTGTNRISQKSGNFVSHLQHKLLQQHRHKKPMPLVQRINSSWRNGSVLDQNDDKICSLPIWWRHEAEVMVEQYANTDPQPLFYGSNPSTLPLIC
ncbi:Inorganic diphosphatase [Bertholletia excelsa]